MTEAPVLTKEQVELKNLRNRIKQLESLEKEKPELLKEISQLKVKARDAISTETTLTKLQKNYNSLKDQNQEYAGRIQELQVAVDDLNRDIKIYKADAEGCKSQVRKMREELEWEQRFKRGLQKMNEKLETRTKQAEHNLLQQVNHLTLTQEKLHSHEEEVTRERAQRLIELHKLHQCELQMEGLHTKFSKQKQTATSALEQEAQMKSLVDPLRHSILKMEAMVNEDAAALLQLERDIEESSRKLEKSAFLIELRNTEIDTLSRRLQKLSKAFGVLQKQLAKHAVTASDKAQLTTMTITHGKPLNLVSPAGKLVVEDNNEAGFSFKLFLEECAAQLDILNPPKLGYSTLNAPVQLAPIVSPPNRMIVKKGSLYVGHGLGLRKSRLEKE